MYQVVVNKYISSTPKDVIHIMRHALHLYMLIQGWIVGSWANGYGQVRGQWVARQLGEQVGEGTCPEVVEGTAGLVTPDSAAEACGDHPKAVGDTSRGVDTSSGGAWGMLSRAGTPLWGLGHIGRGPESDGRVQGCMFGGWNARVAGVTCRAVWGRLDEGCGAVCTRGCGRLVPWL